MTEKRYYQKDFEELYYIIDSNVISEKEFDEKVEYDGYTAFEDSMTGEEIVDLLNENEQLKLELDYWKKRTLLLEHKYDESSGVEWLRNNTVWEQMPSTRKNVTKTSLRPKPTKKR